MAEPRRQRRLRCQWQAVDDRYALEKLAQVYKMLVPEAPPFSITQSTS